MLFRSLRTCLQRQTLLTFKNQEKMETLKFNTAKIEEINKGLKKTHYYKCRLQVYNNCKTLGLVSYSTEVAKLEIRANGEIIFTHKGFFSRTSSRHVKTFIDFIEGFAFDANKKNLMKDANKEFELSNKQIESFV